MAMEPDSPTPSGETVALLRAWRTGDRDALDALVTRIEGELRILARSHLRRERPNHSLHSAELVAEVYLRLMGQRKSPENRHHFFGLAAQTMRRILMNHARDQKAAKRGGDYAKVTLSDTVDGPKLEIDMTRLIEVDVALTELEALDPRQTRVVEMRVFAGMGNQEIADALTLSPATVKREWTMASRWLRVRLAEYRRQPTDSEDSTGSAS